MACLTEHALDCREPGDSHPVLDRDEQYMGFLQALAAGPRKQTLHDETSRIVKISKMFLEKEE